MFKKKRMKYLHTIYKIIMDAGKEGDDKFLASVLSNIFSEYRFSFNQDYSNYLTSALKPYFDYYKDHMIHEGSIDTKGYEFIIYSIVDKLVEKTKDEILKNSQTKIKTTEIQELLEIKRQIDSGEKVLLDKERYEGLKKR